MDPYDGPLRSPILISPFPTKKKTEDLMAQASSSLGQAFSHVDLDAAFGAGTQDLVDATFEEFGGSNLLSQWENLKLFGLIYLV